MLLSDGQVYCCACYFFNYLGSSHLYYACDRITDIRVQIVKRLQTHTLVCVHLINIVTTNLCKVAGMREDLNLKGNQFSILISLFTAG